MRANVVRLGLFVVMASGPHLAAAGTPTEAFLGYHETVLKARSVDDFAALLAKADRDSLKQVPVEAKTVLFDMHSEAARLSAERPKVLKETIDGDKATLDVETTCDYAKIDAAILGKRPCAASVPLVKEPDGWKIAKAPKWKKK
jgi:hypothetical protein